MVSKALCALLGAASFAVTSVFALNIAVSSTATHAIPPTLYGYMWEDINHSGDGGLYGELLQNRALQLVPTGTNATTSLAGWKAINGVTLAVTSATTPVSASLPNSLQVNVGSGTNGLVSFGNTGYWGIKVQSGWNYTGSFYVKSSNYAGPVTVSLRGATSNTVYATTTPVSKVTGTYTKHTFTFTPTSSAPDGNNVFAIQLQATGTVAQVYFGLFSLFPPTFKNRPNGLRMDLAQAMADTAPKVWRFPGGNNLEGESIAQRWKWNETIGPLENRPGRLGDWGYINTDGLGLDEYMQWAEDLDAEVILGVWAGFALNGSPQVVPKDQLQPYIDDAINEIHYLLDPPTTTWGAMRAKNGRTNPYNFTYVEIGNEDFLSKAISSYTSYRWAMFINAIGAEFPNLRFLSTAHDDTKLTPAPKYIDFHDYNAPNGTISLASKWDALPRDGAKYFVGEYAVITTSETDIWGATGRLPYPIMNGSAAEAAFMTSFERNSDVVFASAYAPSLQHINGTQWTPDLITYDAMGLVKSTSYYVQQMFATNLGTHILSSSPTSSSPVFWVASVNQNTNTYYLKVSNTGSSSVAATISLAFAVASPATVTSISGSSSASNTISNKNNVLPKTATVAVTSGNTITYTFPAWSVVVFKMTKPGTSSTSTTITSTSTTTTKTTSSSDPTGTNIAQQYGQCGGMNWTGATQCMSPYVCTYSNSYYSQCL